MIGGDERPIMTATEMIGADRKTVTGWPSRSTTVGADNRRYKTIYIGHSGTTLHNRLLEHKRAILGADKAGSAVFKHHQELHMRNFPGCRSRILDIQPKNLHRLASEALHLIRSRRHTLLNRKGEFGKMHLPRLVVRENLIELRDKE